MLTNNPITSAEEIPSKRFDMFFYTVKKSFISLALISGLTAIFVLPFMGFRFISTIVNNQLLDSVNTAEASQKLQIIKNVIQNLLVTELISIPLIILAFVGFAGLFNAMQKLVWREGGKPTEEFWLGIKTNWKQYLLFGVIFSLIYYLANVGYWYFSLSASNTLEQILSFVVLVFFFGYFGGMAVYCLTQGAVYQLKTIHIVKNSAIFSMVGFFKTLGVMIVALFPIILVYFYQVVWLISLIYLGMAIFGFSYSALVLTLYSDSVMDKYINSEHYPQLVNKGLDTGKTN